ncbi:MAG TPA: glycosyltransferase family 4 protein, partial [Vicinamibacterales bacterium]|nr:glycosyltransferase family 4 protein [Vicinamibacterales bacterium]
GYRLLESRLKALGHTLTIVTPHDLGSAASRGRWTPLLYPIVVARWVRAHRGEFDAFVFHSYAGWIAARPRGRRSFAAVVAFHGLEPLYHRELLEEAKRSGRHLTRRYRALQERAMPFFLRRACQHADLVTCLNAAERRFLVEHGWSAPERTALVAHGIPDEFFAPERPVRPVRTLLFVGQWLPMKGVSYLTSAADALLRHHPGLRLTCAGTLKTAEHVLAGFAPEVRERIRVLPRVERDALPALYRDADVFLSPSLYEGFGLAIVEAMAAGLPIVASEVGVAADALQDGESCLFVLRHDAPALVQAVERLMADAPLAGRLGRAARAIAERYRTSGRSAELAGLLVDLAGRAARTRG